MLTINPLVQVSRRRRDSTSYWASSSSVYNIIASYGTRSNDVRRFPTYRSYLWANKYGASKAYAHFGAGAFAGYNSNCHYKVRLCVCVCVCTCIWHPWMCLWALPIPHTNKCDSECQAISSILDLFTILRSLGRL